MAGCRDAGPKEERFLVSNRSSRCLRWDDNVREILVESSAEITKKSFLYHRRQLGTEDGLDIRLPSGSFINAGFAPLVDIACRR